MKDIIEKTEKWDIDINGIHFCIRALNLKDRRIHISHLMVRSGYMYGTNGRRIHRYKLKGKFKNGLYRVFKHLKSHIIIMKTDEDLSNYPSVSSVFKKNGKNKTNNITCTKDDYIFATSLIIRSLPDYQSINPEFLRDLNLYGATLYIEKDKILIMDGDMAAVLMPLKN